MARTGLPSEITDTVTDPYYLIQMGFSSPVGGYNLSTLYGVTVDSVTYSASRTVSVSNLSADANGNIKGTITIDNSDNAWSTIVLDESPSGLDCTIYKAYSSSPTLSEVVTLFDGHMDKATVSGSTVAINIFSTGAEYLSPGLVIAKPYFNWLPPAGTTIVTGNVTITLEKAY